MGDAEPVEGVDLKELVDAGRRQCRPLDGAKPLSVFEALEAEALLPLPAEPFVLAR